MLGGFLIDIEFFCIRPNHGLTAFQIPFDTGYLLLQDEHSIAALFLGEGLFFSDTMGDIWVEMGSGACASELGGLSVLKSFFVLREVVDGLALH